MHSQKIVKSGLLWLGLSMLILLLDRYSKIWAMQHLALWTPVPIFSILNLTLAHNTGMAFGFLNSFPGWQNIFLGCVSCIISLFILIYLAKQSARAYWTNIALCLVFAGAVGNVWDRIAYGFVIDFISLHFHTWYFAIFNIADSAITVGAIMLLLLWCRKPA